jgi:hypothetical protein
MLVKNTNPRFGEAGPFEIDSINDLVVDMQPILSQYAHNAWHGLTCHDVERDIPEGRKAAWIANQVTALELDLISSLEVLEEVSP